MHMVPRAVVGSVCFLWAVLFVVGLDEARRTNHQVLAAVVIVTRLTTSCGPNGSVFRRPRARSFAFRSYLIVVPFLSSSVLLLTW